MMGWFLGLILMAALVLPAAAQSRPEGYSEAEVAFQQLNVDTRIRIQVLLTAAGYWSAVPNENFNGRIFNGISDFQSAFGFSRTGWLTPIQLERLIDSAAPNLDLWDFQKINHPFRQRPIWVPMGLGLITERTKTGLKFDDPRQRFVLHFDYYPETGIRPAYEHLVAKVLREESTIYFKVLRKDFFVISLSRSGIDGYIRFQQDGRGVLGFEQYWRNDARDISAERIATLVSGSLWSEMTGATFIDPPKFRAPQSVAVARPPAPPVAAKPDNQWSSGTGFFVTRSGHVVTNAHVVDACSTILVKSHDDLSLPARVLARDKVNDLALLKVEGGETKFAAIRSSVRLGEPVAVFGFPLSDLLASSGNFTLGNITALAGLGDDTRYLQMSAPVQAGNSGGPMLDESGGVVGVVTAKLNAMKTVATSGDLPQNVNFAIKASALVGFLDSNRIAYDAQPTTERLSSPDLADRARSISVFIKCN